MEKSDIKKILNYYLEYEIYNIANSSELKINNKSCILIKNLLNYKDVFQNIEILKEEKISEKLEKFIGNKVNDKKQVIYLIKNELSKLDTERLNQAQISIDIKNIIKECVKYKIEERVIKNFINELCEIKSNKEFWIYAHNLSIFFKDKFGKSVKKIPFFILKCEFENERIRVIDVGINTETLNTALSIILNKELSDVVLEYEEQISNYIEELNSVIDFGNIEHLIKIFYIKMEEYINISEKDLINISNINYNFNIEYIVSIDELAEGSIKNIKEDIELLYKLINNDDYVPKLLDKYLFGNTYKNDINDFKYSKKYRGNYISKFGVGANQYKIVNTIKYNDLIAIEGPPGTGKTSLIKEIIANKIVERADLILENWNKPFFIKEYYKTSYYDIPWFNENNDIIKSIVVSSKNGEAIENVGKEINQEIRYMFPVARNYKRIQKDNQEKILQKYKGIVCLPLGKQDNIKDFKDFLYNDYIPMLNRIKFKKNVNEIIERVRENYINKCEEIKKFEEVIDKLNNIDKNLYSYGVSNNDYEKILELFTKDKENKKIKLKNITDEKCAILQKMSEKYKELGILNEKIKIQESEIEKIKQEISTENKKIQILKSQQENFNKISKNLFTKMLNLKDYKKYKYISFSEELTEIAVSIKINDKKLEKYIDDKIKIENQKASINIECDELNEKCNQLEKECENLDKSLKEIEVIELFNIYDKNTYWNYSDSLEIYGKSTLNDLNMELFGLALRLNEAYIMKNIDSIIENLKLFLQEDQVFLCSKFYESTDIYNQEKQNGIKSLWNTLFLCFPVVTTTLDSFSKRCFHLIPEYIDLLLIDEAGQILPHNLVSALYRAKKAVVVGDIRQIEPIYKNVRRNFTKNKISIGNDFENIKIDSNSIQALANKNTDILDNCDNIILNNHYRCEKNIINFSNEVVYDNRLNMHISDNFDKPFLNNMIALDIRGKRNLKENLNKVEIESCIETIKYIKKKNENKVSIAVITLFKKQKHEIEKSLENIGINDVEVGTVHAFQGQEKDYIIFSSVIDSSSIKWATNFIGKKCNMLNVAVTRAKKQFIYLGNLKVAEEADNYMTKLLNYIKRNGLIYSLYDMEDSILCENFDNEILKILQPELKIENDNIGLYIGKNIENGVIKEADEHYKFLRYVLKNVKEELYIMSPWIRENVINKEFFEDIKRLKQQKCNIKIIFGYRKGNKKISSAKELALELQNTGGLGFSSKESVEKIAEKMYEILGKENFIYSPPVHAKILIIDGKYMCIGSHNWLSNAGKMNESNRAKEGTRLTTSVDAIKYVKDEFFENL